VIKLNIINDYNDGLSLDNSSIDKLIKKIFNSEECSNAKVNIVLTNRDLLSNLKKKYFNVNQYTDVIAFNLEENGEEIEGEIYISIDDVLENSNLFSVSFNNEFKRILIHGILHLLGYDDQKSKEIEIMKALEEKYLLNSNNDIIFLK